MKRIVYTEDGLLSVVTPGLLEGETEEQALNRVLAESPQGSIVLEAEDLPSDRLYRDAWKIENGSVAIDLDRAKEIHATRVDGREAEIAAAQSIEELKVIV